MAETVRRQHFIDPWSYFDYKDSFTQQNLGPTNPNIWPAGNLHPPFWVGHHWRRLQAYKLLDSYCRNSSREWLKDIREEDRRKRREYGDPDTIVESVLASLLGDDQSIIVEGAEGDDQDEDDPDAPITQTAAQKQFDMLMDWAQKEQLKLKMVECERAAVKLGDGVYVLGWDPKKKRPRLHVYDPGFYFPVLAQDFGDDFPERVAVAWEFRERDESGEEGTFVRKISWWLDDIQGYDENNVPVPDLYYDNAVLQENEEFDPDQGKILRKYPWNDESVPVTCYMTDATWKVEDIHKKVDDFDEKNAMFQVDEDGNTIHNLDLQIDFIPVIHMPNFVALQEHYSRSILATILQIEDDLIATDTDLQAASATTGTPPIAVSGSNLPKDERGQVVTYGPGTVFETGEGKMEALNTSENLNALIKYDEHLLSRLSVNARIPESLLGRVKPNEVPSGIALTLSFSPHSSMIREMRMVRAAKYELMLKMVSRFFMADGQLDSLAAAHLVFGSYLPADKQEASTLVTSLLNGTHPSISLETAVKILMAAGFPIDDAVEEVSRIREEDFAAANLLLDATGDIALVRKRLDVGPPPLAITPPGITDPNNPTPAPTIDPTTGLPLPPGGRQGPPVPAPAPKPPNPEKIPKPTAKPRPIQ